jgi:type II restriction enzyme
MKHSEVFVNRIGCRNPDEVFKYLLRTTKETIRGWDFFVNWAKITHLIENIEVPLNILNTLIGKANIKEEFVRLALKYPDIIAIIPLLIATREKNIKILEPTEENVFNYKNYIFDKAGSYSINEIRDIADFLEKTGLINIFENRRIKNLVDYVTGVEVGLDTNARKNRSGTAMEKITELFVKKICQNYGYVYITQTTGDKIKECFGYNVATDKADRSFDFAISNGNKLYLIETNYYSGGGSKLKSVAGEFSTLYNFLRNNTPEHGFIWITDGKGWETAHRPLREAFDLTDYILNLNMVETGILEDIIIHGL